MKIKLIFIYLCKSRVCVCVWISLVYARTRLQCRARACLFIHFHLFIELKFMPDCAVCRVQLPVCNTIIYCIFSFLPRFFSPFFSLFWMDAGNLPDPCHLRTKSKIQNFTSTQIHCAASAWLRCCQACCWHQEPSAYHKILEMVSIYRIDWTKFDHTHFHMPMHEYACTGDKRGRERERKIFT